MEYDKRLILILAFTCTKYRLNTDDYRIKNYYLPTTLSIVDCGVIHSYGKNIFYLFHNFNLVEYDRNFELLKTAHLEILKKISDPFFHVLNKKKCRSECDKNIKIFFYMYLNVVVIAEVIHLKGKFKRN